MICFFPAHKYGQAIDLYTKAIERNSQNAVYWANRAFAHIKLEEYGSAIQDATKAIEVDPKYSKACFIYRNRSAPCAFIFVLFLMVLQHTGLLQTWCCLSCNGEV